jgi:hypothetical protein
VKIGVTGHQARPNLDWAWCRATLRDILSEISPFERALSSLAIGSDQLFAEVALELGIPLEGIIPFPDYERCFNGKELDNYRRLSMSATYSYVLPGIVGNDEKSFLIAGQEVVKRSDIMIAIWDGKQADGLGGTGDVVDYALSLDRRVRWIDPFSMKITTL